ncbi:hypothetical protein K461DRAFT_290527 [Myriangium duriaei CBS 260.36]|uniref:Uncharacterized protein n=1 Tax=Myriangium duriaei CBS 260.36 TaxID=1168546 RepID=A0A9P4J618_9PEZI|nr:hypothetical protein K461DRAFT_290527 [Myriangium duriaei CBS 260.36]
MRKTTSTSTKDDKQEAAKTTIVRPTSTATKVKGAASPTATLVPALSSDHNGADLNHLRPQNSSALYYAESTYKTNPYLKHMYASMNVSFSYPTIILDHSTYLHDLQCNLTNKEENERLQGYMEFSILTKPAFDIISSTWNQTPNLALVIRGDDCEKTVNNTRSYWLGFADKIEWFDAKSSGYVRYVGDEIMQDEGITDVSLVWGSTYIAPQNYSDTGVVYKNTKLCNEAWSKKQDLPGINPCTASFDSALDQVNGFVYSPFYQRYTDLESLLLNAQARGLIIEKYVAAVSKRAVRVAAMTKSSFQMLKSLGNDMRDPRHLYKRFSLSDIGDAIWGGLKSIGNAFEEAANQTLNFFKNLPDTVSSAFKSLGNYIYEGLKAAGEGLVEGFKQLGRYAEKAAEKMKDLAIAGLEALDDLISSWEPSLHAHADLEVALKPLVTSPFGEAYLIYNYTHEAAKSPKKDSKISDVKALEIYEDKGDGKLSGFLHVFCVKCGMETHNNIHGKARFSILHGVKELVVGIDGDFHFGINIGIDMSVEYKFPQQKQEIIPPTSLVALELPGILILGPIVQMHLTLDTSVYALGQMLAGIDVSMPSYHASYDFIDSDNTYATGFDNVNVKKYFKITGEVGAKAILAMPFSIGIGVNIPPAKFDKQVKLINTPALSAQAAIAGMYSTGDEPPEGITLPKDPKCANGVSWAVDFQDSVDLDVFDGVYKKNIWKSPKYDITSGCYHFGGGSSSSSGSSSNTGGDTSSTTIGNSSMADYVTDLIIPVGTEAKIKSGRVVQSAGYDFVMLSGLDGNLYLSPSINYHNTNLSVTHFQPVVEVENTWTNYTLTQNWLQVGLLALATDDYNRAFFYFPDVLNVFGVSRIRMLDPDQVPRNAKQTILYYGSFTGKNGKILSFIDIDTPFKGIYAVGCIVEDALGRNFSKVFAVTDLKAGVATLQANSPELRSSVTGGTIHKCEMVWLEPEHKVNLPGHIDGRCKPIGERDCQAGNAGGIADA